MGIVALGTTGRGKRLPLVSLDERLVFDVVAVDAQGWDRLRQVIVEFLFPPFADFVSRMTGVTPHIERGMATSFFRHIQPLRMAIETEIFPLLARSARVYRRPPPGLRDRAEPRWTNVELAQVGPSCGRHNQAAQHPPF